MHRLAYLALAACAVPSSDDASEALARAQRIEVDPGAPKHAVRPVLLGANVNKWFDNAQGLWDPDAGAPDADATAKIVDAQLGLLRYPGGTSANLFDWKRAIGAHRGCQMEGDPDGTPHADMDYGPFEFGQLLAATGAQGQIMVPFARMTPADAADWVEYMNATATAAHPWAQRRGGPPIGIQRWELGNELDRRAERYWMSADDETALAQYIDGWDHHFVKQPLARDCDLHAHQTTSAHDQTFYFRWGLVKGDPEVFVGSTKWTLVDSFDHSTKTDRHFTFDRAHDSITFGDGTHGAVPPAGQEVTASYDFHHAGFTAIYDAMKAVDPSIDVCATWAPVENRDSAELGRPSFAQAMSARHLAHRYDCVVMHPYTAFERDFGTTWTGPVQAHEQMMIGDGWARRMVASLVRDVGREGTGQYVAISEFGALWFGDSQMHTDSTAAVPNSSNNMSHAVYMASQWMHDARLNLGWVEGNDLVASPNSIRGVLGGKNSGFLVGAEALTRRAIGPAFDPGATWVANEVVNGALADRGYPLLVTGATLRAGKLRIIVVNRGRTATKATIAAGHHAATIAVATVAGDKFDSANDADGPGDDSVALTTDTLTETGDFAYTFPAASITVLTSTP